MKQETMSTSDLVNLANQLICTLDDSTKRKNTNPLIFNYNKWRSLNKTKLFLVFAITAKIQGTGRKWLQTEVLQTPSVLQVFSNYGTLRNYRGFSQSFYLTGCRENGSSYGQDSLLTLIYLMM